jgi:hypothetical protein
MMTNKRTWLKSEENYLIENYPHNTATQIAQHLNRSLGAIQQRAFNLGVDAINRSGAKTNWTESKLSFLKKNFNKMTTEQLCNRLEIKDTVVRMKMKELGLRKCNHVKWIKEWDNYLISNYEIKGDVRLADEFEHLFPKGHKWTFRQIRKRRVYLNLVRTKEQVKTIMNYNATQGASATIHQNNGSVILSDKFIAMMIAGGSKYQDVDLKNKILNQNPELIELKRTQIKLRRLCKH